MKWEFPLNALIEKDDFKSLTDYVEKSGILSMNIIKSIYFKQTNEKEFKENIIKKITL